MKVGKTGVLGIFLSSVLLAFVLMITACTRANDSLSENATPTEDTGRAVSETVPVRSSVSSSQAASRQSMTIPIEGMSCFSCVASIQKAVKSMDGVFSAEVNLQERRATVVYDGSKVSPDLISMKILELGYKPGQYKLTGHSTQAGD